MIQIIIPENERYDYDKKEFVYFKGAKLVLEHSLIALSKWEANWNKPLLETEMSPEEKLDYIKWRLLVMMIPLHMI